MKKFELRTWMTENKEDITSKWEALKEEQFYNGIQLNPFLWEVWNSMKRQNPRSSKRAASLLPYIVGQVYVNNSRIGGTEVQPNFSAASEASRRQLPSSMR